MKCLSCGADIKAGARTCEFCGESITVQMQKEREQLRKPGCPKCGSTNVKFDREKQGEVRSKKGTAVVRATVGFCKDCGHTWNASGNTSNKKKKTGWWILGWLCIFPLPLTILLLRKKNMKPAVKYGIIAVAWLLYLIIGFGGSSDESQITNVTDTEKVVETEVKEEPVVSHIYDNVEVIDQMNGTGTEKIGTITVTRAKQSECTDEALLDWYCNYVKKDSESSYHVIVYSDVADKGIYSNGFGFIQKDITLIAEDNGTYMLGDDAGSIYYTVDEAAKKLTKQASMADSAVVEDVTAKVDAIVPDDYKNGKMYAVDVAGEEGDLDCYLTLINDGFASADYQSIAVDLASQIKELDLGIGYFCIAFQSDDYTLKALSNMDDLSHEEASEITTKEF